MSLDTRTGVAIIELSRASPLHPSRGHTHMVFQVLRGSQVLNTFGDMMTANAYSRQQTGSYVKGVWLSLYDTAKTGKFVSQVVS